jgi:hypothetical protein
MSDKLNFRDFEEAEAFVTGLHQETFGRGLPPQATMGSLQTVWGNVGSFVLWLAELIADDNADIQALRAFGDRITLGGFDIAEICPLWIKAKPVVTMILKFPLIPLSWKKYIDPVVELADMLCPTP